jgi:hypothetical protein
LIFPEDKQELLQARLAQPNWVRTEGGHGEIFRLALISKLVLLAITKFSSLDPHGMGLEMEAGRPGWDDALNGLPGLFGSSLSDSYDLLRLVDFLTASLAEQNRPVDLPLETSQLLDEISDQISQDQPTISRWDGIATARETYREQTRLGVQGGVQSHSSSELLTVLEAMGDLVRVGIEKAQNFEGEIPPAYFRYELNEYQITEGTDPEGRPLIRPISFTAKPLPPFLEGPVHQLTLLSSRADCLELYQKVRSSKLYDPKLKTYKVNAPLTGEPLSIGRARAFSPGWLENESIWMHMTLKYLLEILKAGLYEEFFEDLQHTLPPFLDPEVYGRSILENSSFIVSSAHPDPSLHGRGFVARLSGATAEFISIWFTMMTGGKPFSLDSEGQLEFSLQPRLPGWLFPEHGILEFTFLGKTLVRIHNPKRIDTWKASLSRYQLIGPDQEISIRDAAVPEPQAAMVRDGKFTEIEIHYQ